MAFKQRRRMEPMPMTTNIVCCARCGKDHEKIEFKPFKLAGIATQNGLNSHWASCPETGEPILMRIEAA